MKPAVRRVQYITERLQTSLSALGYTDQRQSDVINEFLRHFRQVQNEAVIPDAFYNLGRDIDAIARNRGVDKDYVQSNLIHYVGDFFSIHRIPFNKRPEPYDPKRHTVPPVQDRHEKRSDEPRRVRGIFDDSATSPRVRQSPFELLANKHKPDRQPK